MTSLIVQRMDAVRRVLEGAGGRIHIDEIARRMRDEGHGHLLRVVSPSQTLGPVLRRMEREGDVDRSPERQFPKWGIKHYHEAPEVDRA